MKKRLLFLFSLLICVSSLAAQQITVTGTVIDNFNDPIPGASIRVKGTNTGTITDIDGKYSMKTKEGNTLMFSFIGYETIEAKATSAPLSITMRENSVLVDEVVVTALGIKREKKSLAYSVTEVKGDEMNRVKSTNIATGLVGKVAGVNVVKPASGVMGSSRITIRGNGSLSGSNQPLYVIDGVPMDNSGYGQAGVWGGNDGGDGISSVNSEDIESMSVLKGGTAAALYGSRAANGAIVITTKKGRSGKPKVEYSGSYTFDKPVVKNEDFQWEYGQGAYGMKPNEFMNAKQFGMLSWGAKLDGTDAEQFDGVSRPYSANGKDNFENFYNNGSTLSNNVSVSGGNDNTQFRISLGDVRSNDLFPNSKLERNNITLNLNSKLTDKFSIQSNVMYVRERVQNRPNLGDLIMNGNAFLWIAPTSLDIRTLEQTVDENGNEYLPTNEGWISNPYFIAHNRKQSDSKDRVIGSIQAKYDFTENLYFRGRAGGDMIIRRTESVIPKGTGYDPYGSVSSGSTFNGEFNVEAIAGYSQSFDDAWDVNAFVGWNTMTTWWQSVSANGSRLIDGNKDVIGNTETNSGGSSTSENYINSLFGQAEVSYMNTLFLTMTGRNDWFSALSYKGKTTPNHIFYPSVGLGVVASQAMTMPDWFPFLKLRGSWAKSGGSIGPYNLGMTYRYNQSFNGNPIGSINPSTIPNINLKPLSSITYEVGADARFFNNRLGLDFTYYVRDTHDDIVSAGISSTSGYESVKVNAGKVHNNGVELLLTADLIQNKNFNWNTSFNFSYNNSEIKFITDDITEFTLQSSRTGLQGGDGAPGYISHEVGQPYGIIKGYGYERNDQGQIVYDANGFPIRGEIQKLGESVHPWTVGFSNNFEYKGFTLNILLDAKFGGSILSGTNNNAYTYGKHKDTLEGRDGKNTISDPNMGELAAIIGDGVKEDGTPNDTKVNTMDYYMHISHNITEEFVYDASFIKLRELSFGYRFPRKMISTIGLADLQLSVVGRNLWNIYDNTPLVDPESSFNNGNAQGLEMYGLPTTRSIGFNLNVKF
jgi:TonB-linked SusC/RagA family outer membrane protein